LASYIALSARSINWLAVSPASGKAATPRLNVTLPEGCD
jgi:hypothetical protein